MTREMNEVMGFVAEWYDIAVGKHNLPDNAYAKFLALWVAFNGFYSAKFPNAKTEMAQIRSFANWSKAKTVHADALASDTSYQVAVEELRKTGVFNYVTKNTEHISNAQRLDEVIPLVYRVRCSLFHARKVPSNLRDQILVNAAHVIVAKLLDQLIERPLVQARAVTGITS